MGKRLSKSEGPSSTNDPHVNRIQSQDNQINHTIHQNTIQNNSKQFTAQPEQNGNKTS